MTTFPQFASRARMRHDFSDQIQVRYRHPNGEEFDTWISGEEVLARLKTASREELIKSFSQMNLKQAKREVKKEIEERKKQFRSDAVDRLGGLVEENIGGNIFGDTLADNIRDRDSNRDEFAEEKQQWQSRLSDEAFRLVALQLAWTNIGDTLPDEPTAESDDWV
jgi:Rad3-related DNA helicase